MKAWEAAAMRAVLPQAGDRCRSRSRCARVVKLGLTAAAPAVRPGKTSGCRSSALERVDLDGFAGRYYQELSGGEQQRVQLARVLCQVWTPVLDGEPRYLLLDEPVSSLDIRHQLIIMGIARDFADAGGGVIAILHDLNLTAMYADRIYVMHRGRLEISGAPADVLTDHHVSRVFECDLKVGVAPRAGSPFVLPQSATP
jgi:iron complex transport system ATP-binding protein